MKWQPIETAPWSKPDRFGERWLSRVLLASEGPRGWQYWVGQCDAGDIWLATLPEGGCVEVSSPPAFWAPLPEPLQ